MSDWEKSALLLAMSCLAKSEYETWLSLIKNQYNDLLADDYIKWLKINRENLFGKLKADFIIKSKQEKLADMFSVFSEMPKHIFPPPEIAKEAE